MAQHAVVIVGAGPTGLMLAAELALARVDVAIVERRLTQDFAGLRAGGLHSRTLEVLDQRGIVDRFLSEGQVAQTGCFAQTKLDISDFPTRHPYGLGLWQSHFERILAGWVGELAVPIYRGREVRGFVQDDTGVDIELSAGNGLRAEYLVGCDGGRSLIRKAAGIEFPGWDATTSSLIAAVEMAEKPELGIHRTALGIHAFGREEYEIRDGKVIFKDVGPIRVMVPEQHSRARRRTHTARSQRGADQSMRDRLRGAQSHVYLQIHRYGAAGGGLPQRAGPASRGRCARAFPGRGTGPQHRCAGCSESGLEVGPGRQGNIA